MKILLQNVLKVTTIAFVYVVTILEKNMFVKNLGLALWGPQGKKLTWKITGIGGIEVNKSIESENQAT